jgi:hypothetical protein
MKKSHIVLLIGGALIAGGMIASYFGSNLATQDLAVTEGSPKEGSPIEITKDLDPGITNVGAFIVHAESFEGGEMSATVFDPNNNQIATKKIDQVSTEEQFEISTKGTYRLVLENSGGEVSAIIGLTHMPEKSVLALNVFGQGVIVSGFVGLVIAVIYLVKDRRKSV